MSTVATDRLIIRPPVEGDRRRFLELFTDESFTVFSGGVHDLASANDRFDRMLAVAATVPFAKQPVVERSSGAIVGYTGVDSIHVDGLDRLEWGWRFAIEARGKGYATEATAALLAHADTIADGDVLCLIAPDNLLSHRVADKVGFRPWRRIDWDGDPAEPTDLLLRPIGEGGPPLLMPTLG